MSVVNLFAETAKVVINLRQRNSECDDTKSLQSLDVGGFHSTVLSSLHVECVTLPFDLVRKIDNQSMMTN
jgi:hypothetical protein